MIEGPGAARIELAGLADRPRYLVRELLMALWRRQGWPLQAMGRQKWEELGASWPYRRRRCDGPFPAA